MGKLYKIKKIIISAVAVICILAGALGFSYILGRYFIENIVKDYPVSKSVYKTVYYPVTIKKVRLQPLSIYTLQVGVFTDLKGAKDFAVTLTAKGLKPFITLQAPYKVFVFAAPSREKLEQYKQYATEDAFVVNDILNETEVAVRSDTKIWMDFLPQFAELFTQSLNVICENGDDKDSALSAAWLKTAGMLNEQALKDKKNARQITALATDIMQLAQEIDSQRSTIQSQAQAAQILLKTKHDYDILRDFLAKID